MEKPTHASSASNIKAIVTDKYAREKGLLARLPKPINCIRKEGNKILSKLLNDCFSATDDTLFELAKNALKQEDQDNYFVAMNKLRVEKKSINDQFIAAINSAFSQLAIPPEGPDEKSGLTPIAIDQLSIVNNKDLDKIVAKEALAAKAITACEYPLQALSTRINAVVVVEIEPKEIPFSPEKLCDYFTEAVKTMAVCNKSTLVLYKTFEQNTLNHLGAFYKLMNGLLIDRGILSEKIAERTALEQEPEVSHDGSGGLHMPIVTCDMPLPDGHHIPRVRSKVRAQILPVQNQDPAHVNKQTTSLFDLLSHQQTSTTEPHSVDENYLSHLIQTTNGSLSSKNRPELAISAEESTTVSILDQLFHTVDSRMPMAAPVKSLFQSLQVPLAKIALTDKTFFDNPDHSARKLLNTLSAAAVRCDSGDATGLASDPLYNEIEKVIYSLVHNQTPSTADFSTHLDDFERFSEKEKRKEQVLEKHLVRAEQGRLKSLKVESTVIKTIEDVCQGLEIKPTVQEIIQGAWKSVMMYIGLKHGDDSEQWDNALQTLINLVISTQPCVNDIDRRQASDSLHELKTEITQGLLSISYDPFKTDSLIQRLEATFQQLAKPEAHTSTQVGFSNTPDNQHLGENSPTSTIEKMPKQAFQESASTDINVAKPSLSEAFVNQAKTLSRGTWFDLDQGDEKVRCRLAAIIEPYSQYIFVNRSGIKVTDNSLNEVALMLQQQELIYLDSNHIFDSALEQVISGIKDSTKKSG